MADSKAVRCRHVRDAGPDARSSRLLSDSGAPFVRSSRTKVCGATTLSSSSPSARPVGPSSHAVKRSAMGMQPFLTQLLITGSTLQHFTTQSAAVQLVSGTYAYSPWEIEQGMGSGRYREMAGRGEGGAGKLEERGMRRSAGGVIVRG